MTLTALHSLDARPERVRVAAPSQTWPDRLGGAVALAIFALTPLVAYVGNLGFAPLVALAGLVALPAAAGRRRLSPAALILLALLAWALVSLQWSGAAPTGFRSWRDLESFTGLKLVFELALYGAFVAAAARASEARARLSLLIVGVGFAAVVVLLLAEAASNAALYQAIKHALHQHTRPDLARRNVARAAYPLALLIWPAALLLHDKGWRYAVLIAGFGGAAVALALGVDAPIAALAAGGLASLAVRHGRRAGAWAVLLAAMAYFALAPLAILGLEHLSAAPGLAERVGKHSWGVRLDVWRFVADRIAERPLQGWGLDASRTWPGVVPLHPHDAALQLWLELGAPGALAAVLFFGAVFSWIAAEQPRDPEFAAAAAGSAVAYIVVGALSFGVWQEWWLALGAIAWAAILLARRTRHHDAAPATARGALSPLA